MGNYTIFEGLENPRRGRQARNLTTNDSKILDLKSSSEQIFSKNRHWVPLFFGGLKFSKSAKKTSLYVAPIPHHTIPFSFLLDYLKNLKTTFDQFS